MITKPKISFVVGLREYNYGRKYGMDNRYRTQLFLDNLIYWCNRYKMPSELIFVEWNVLDFEYFRSLLKWPQNNTYVTVRWIPVPSTLHRRLPNSRKVPIFEFFAKNVGIRRARGEYILATNPDLLYSSGLILFLTQTTFAKNFFYRVDRLDVAGYIRKSDTILQRLRFCQKHVVKRHAFYGSIKSNSDLFSFWKEKKKTQRYIEAYWQGSGLVSQPDGLHRNASGDFFLMSKKWWHRLRGYAELATHAHIDSIMCWQATTAGLQQTILPQKLKLYHIDHDRKIQRTFPKTNWRMWAKKFKQHQKQKKIMMVNDTNWGLAKEKLPIYTIF